MVSLWWKRGALVLLALLVLSLAVNLWTRIQAGVSAAVYLQNCIASGLCHTPQDIDLAARMKKGGS